MRLQWCGFSAILHMLKTNLEIFSYCLAFFAQIVKFEITKCALEGITQKDNTWQNMKFRASSLLKNKSIKNEM